MSHFLISATQKSSGKTTVSIGLSAELRRRGVAVQPFKKGPDYIDPLWLTRASGRSCVNLDFHTQGRDEIVRSFVGAMSGAAMGLIEGNLGLFDGQDLHRGADSNAALAILLRAPVVLVIDVQGLTRGVAPLLLGYQAFAPELQFAGIVLNKVGGGRHGQRLREVVEHHTDFRVLGTIARDSHLGIAERHLGLIPSNEARQAAAKIEEIRACIADQVDVDALLDRAQCSLPRRREPPAGGDEQMGTGLRIGIARDEAFGFYYPGDLSAFERAGARLVFFSPLRDRVLPEVDGLFLGGGFPEVMMDRLEANAPMRAAVRGFIERDGPAYAECGGLMYLSRSIRWRGRKAQMVGVIGADAVMGERPVGRGYVRLRPTVDYPWPGLGREQIPCHEFHHSSLEGLDAGYRFAYRVERGQGIDGRHDGILYRNLMASYSHLRDVERDHWTERFLRFVALKRRLLTL